MTLWRYGRQRRSRSHRAVPAPALGVDLKFQNFGHEIRHLSEVYGPPRGCLLLAHQASQAVGCVALRGLDVEVCEMKRLYVRAGLRGSGIGRRLVRAVIDRALLLGYRRMVLDTLASMHTALALYSRSGFVRQSPIYPNPLQDATSLELDLASSGCRIKEEP